MLFPRVCARFLNSPTSSPIVANSSRTGVRESSANNTVVRASVNSRINSRTSPVYYVQGFLQNSRTLGDLLKNIPYYSEYFAKALRKCCELFRSIHIICWANYREQFANFGNGLRIISQKTKRTIMNTGYTEQFANNVRTIVR